MLRYPLGNSYIINKNNIDAPDHLKSVTTSEPPCYYTHIINKTLSSVNFFTENIYCPFKADIVIIKYAGYTTNSNTDLSFSIRTSFTSNSNKLISLNQGVANNNYIFSCDITHRVDNSVNGTYRFDIMADDDTALNIDGAILLGLEFIKY